MAVKFLRATPEEADVKVLAGLKAALKKYKRVLWIVTGGSNIPRTARVMKEVSEADSAKLAVILSDERFGLVGHPESNLRQLYDAGFEAKRATVVPVLRPEVDLEETVRLYGQAARTAFTAADFVFAQLGMGPDGHIAGILPHSPAVKPTKQWVITYGTPDYTRITLTPYALSHISEAFLPSFGEARNAALHNLRDKQLSIAQQPAQLLKKIPKLTVLNDQLGEKA